MKFFLVDENDEIFTEYDAHLTAEIIRLNEKDQKLYSLLTLDNNLIDIPYKNGSFTLENNTKIIGTPGQ